MEYENQTNENAENEVINEKNYFNESENQTKKKGKGKFALIAIIVIILAAVIGLAYYFLVYSKPEEVYKRAITEAFDAYSTTETKTTNYSTINSTLKLNADVDIDEDYLDEDIIDLINGLNLILNLQLDEETSEAILNIESTYDDESLLNAQLYTDSENAYLKIEELSEDYIDLEMDSESYVELFAEDDSQEINKDLVEILEKELKSIIKSEYCSSEKVDILVDGKAVSTTKNTLTLNGEQLVDEFLNILNDLVENQDFLETMVYYYEDATDADDVKELLEDTIAEIEESDYDDAEDYVFEMNIYTTGIMQNAIKYEVVLTDEYYDEQYELAFTKISENDICIEYTQDDLTIVTAEISLEETNDNEGVFAVDIKIAGIGKINATVEYSNIYDEEIDNVKVRNSVTLEESGLYDLISEMLGLSSSSQYDDYYGTETSTSENQIISYDDKTYVTFGLPDGFETTYASDYYKSFTDYDTYTEIYVYSEYSTVEEFYEGLEDYKEYYESYDEYTDISLTDISSVTVNGVTFYTASVSYTYSSYYAYDVVEQYYWTQISDDYVVEFIISGEEVLSTSELQELLTIEISNAE